MLWSASAKTKNPDAAIAWINWWVNSPEAADIDLAERGIPANSEIQSDITPKLSQAQQARARSSSPTSSPSWPTPRSLRRPAVASSATSCSATQTDVLFGRQSTADAAQKFVDEMKSNLQG